MRGQRSKFPIKRRRGGKEERRYEIGRMEHLHIWEGKQRKEKRSNKTKTGQKNKRQEEKERREINSCLQNHSYTLTPFGSLRYCMHRFSHLEEMTNVVFLLFPGSQSRNLDLIKHPESQGYWDLFNEKKGERERVTLFHQKDQILLTFKPSQGLPGSSWHLPAWKTADCLVFPSQLWVELHKKQVPLVNQCICNRWICSICGWVSNQCQIWMQISCLLAVYWNHLLVCGAS